MAQRGYRTIKLDLKSGDQAPIRASARIADALEEITRRASLYHGVKLMQVLEAVYIQGRKDGAREAFEQIDRSLTNVKKTVPHRSVGRPRKSR